MNFKLTYDDLFMNMAYLISMKSKDESTKIGAVVVDDDNIVVSMGFNSLPRGINDNIKERQKNPHKYSFMAHAERNSIYNSSRKGISLKNYTLYTLGFPCSGCTIAIIQSGIKEIVLCSNWQYNNNKWNEESKISKEMLDEANISIRYWNGTLQQIKACNGGEVYNF